MTDLSGTVLDGKYELVTMVGEGGMMMGEAGTTGEGGMMTGEGGMMGLEVDPDFDDNGYVYICMASSAGAENDSPGEHWA